MMGTTNKDGSSKRTHSFNSLKMSGHVSSKRIYDRLKHFPFEHIILFSIVIAGGFSKMSNAHGIHTDTGNDASGRLYIGWWFGGVKMFRYVLFFHFHMV